MWTYFKRLTAALAGQLYGDDAFLNTSFIASTIFYTLASELYTTTSLKEAIQAAREEDPETKNFNATLGRSKRRSSLSEIESMSLEEKNMIDTRFSMIVVG